MKFFCKCWTMTLACLREKEVMRKDKVSHHTGDSIVDPNTVLSMGRVIVLDLPSREAILTDFMNGGEDTSLPIEEFESNPHTVMVLTSCGGHFGFLEGIYPSDKTWMNRTVRQLLEAFKTVL